MSPSEPITDSACHKARKPVRVLARPYLESRSNPYQRLLYQAFLNRQTAIERFTLRRLLTQNWTIWHYHWPESALIGIPRWAVPQAITRTLRYWCYLKIARRRGIKIVWTVHNLHPHEPNHPWLEKAWLRLFAQNIDAAICMSESGKQELNKHLPVTREKPTYIIPHGHYRGCYPDTVTQTQARQQLDIPPTKQVALFLGMIRPYKNVTKLARSFTKAQAVDWTLVIAGKSTSDALRQEIEESAAACPDISLKIGFVPDETLQTYLRAADIFIAPYEDVLNSGSAILSLSFDCPVLVPNKGAMRDLQKTVGRDWVMTYDGPLNEDVLRAAFDFANTSRPNRAPLENLDWSDIAKHTLTAFDSVLNGNPPPPQMPS